ncbi:Heavy metal-(Cd/Co/Hg/Pb/Zn)-translocating P-type ATPase [uncultured Pleomorphomonas sp.]|uniref:P-type Zn(2+) transporter n=1 Tax=uncultured Pleomorphomonas sp. TaxID=442121 RepID=A0A212KY70_9HYPH|nr:heavy metal translocating P-type ATPase [uncultured Pleomorphomonas sp.]SCM70251.1 Heavy metal-(Cd/Co/Hg/Pb/Zn)-translocating P-type ATPase [uncultured Pleomorphomonas sp.]
MADTALKTRFKVDGMDCAACAARVEGAVARIGGVEDVSVSVMTGSMVVHHDDSTDLAALESAVSRLGYGISADRPEPPATRHDEDGHSCDCCGHGDAGHEGHDHHDHDHGDAAHEEDGRAGHDHAAHEHAGHDHAGHVHAEIEGAWWQSAAGLQAIGVGIGIVVAYAVGQLVPQAERWLFLAVMLAGLAPIARRAFRLLQAGEPFSIESLMTIAAVGAVFLDAAAEAAAVVFFFLVGELLEGLAARKARSSIKALAGLVPETAHLLTGGATREVAASALAIDDEVLVRPGDRVPGDGVVVAGMSSIDESMVTGESVPVTRGEGASVYAGTINGDGVLTVRVTAPAADNTIARIVRLVTEAQETRAPVERFVNRFAKYYTPAVVAVAVAVAVLPPLLDGNWAGWIYKGLAVLLIGCPCALVISTPAAIAASLASGARTGLLIKGGSVLERLRDVTAVAFDKTGTLTEGTPQVTDVEAYGADRDTVLRLSASLEASSSHPLAKAVLAAAGGAGLSRIEDGKAVPGKGVTGRVEDRDLFFGSADAAAERTAVPAEVSAAVERHSSEGKTICLLLADGAVLGLVALRDAPRPDAVAAVADLRRRGITTVMLTGDNPRAAAAVGRELGIDDVRAGLLPADKQDAVKALQDKGLVVAKIGDGINDAPALATADIGIAMGGGTDVALEAADAALLYGRVGDVAALVDLSRRTMANIRQNITIALGLKAFFLVTTVLGITGLWPAILADTGATVLVTANALRLLRSGR